jgi:carboxypeptidase PM20D1
MEFDFGQVLTTSLLAVAATVVGVCAVNTVRKSRRTRPVYRATQDTELVDAFSRRKDEIAARLAAAIRFPTVSFDRPESCDDNAPPKWKPPTCGGFHGHFHPHTHTHAAPAPAIAAAGAAGSDPKPVPADPYAARRRESEQALLSLHTHLQACYPLLHARLDRRVVNEYSLVFVWRGSDPSLQAMGLYAHMDVVPADDKHLWTVDPFGGVIRDGWVWGRGAIDDKQAVITICEALEHLLTTGFRPRRTVVLMFGHDEEISGAEGMARITDWVESSLAAEYMPLLAQRQREAQSAGRPVPKPLAFFLDEGLFVLDGAVPGHKDRTALICTAEKGFVDVELSVRMQGGHSSQPPKESAVGVLARAITRLEESPHPIVLGPESPTRRMFESLIPGMTLPLRVLFANLWLTKPLIGLILSRNPKTATTVRTTTATTIVAAGTKVNTVPFEAKAWVNHRIIPGDTVETVLNRDAAIIADSRVQYRVGENTNPLPVSDATAPAFGIIARAVERIFPNTVAAPALMVGATDSKWGVDIAENIYRHCPTELHISQTHMFHGLDERVQVDNLARMAAFYARVVLECDAADL